MLRMMKESNLITDMERAVRRLALEHPEWLPVLEATAALAGNVEEHGGEFAGHAHVVGQVGLDMLDLASARMDQDDIERLQGVIDLGQRLFHIAHADPR